MCIRVEPHPERANTKNPDDPAQGCKICFQQLQKHQQRIINASCFPMGITLIQEDKFQLTLLFKIINDLVDIRAGDYLASLTRSTRQAHSKKFRQISIRTDSYKFSFFLVPSQFGIPSQHQFLRPLLWYLSRRDYSPYPSKQCLGPGCLLTHQVVSCAVWDVRALVPPGKAEWSLIFIW